jgi:hypothetical protein
LVLTALIAACGGSGSASPENTAVTPAQLMAAAKTIPALSNEPADIATLAGLSTSSFVVSSGLPINDLEYTLYNTDYIEGETTGYDTFMPVYPSDPSLGANSYKLIVPATLQLR